MMKNHFSAIALALLLPAAATAGTLQEKYAARLTPPRITTVSVHRPR